MSRPPAPSTTGRLGLTEVIHVLRWLTVDTFRQSLSSFIFWVMLLLTLAAILFCFGIGMEGGASRLQGEHFLPAEVASERESVDLQFQWQRALQRRVYLACLYLQTGYGWMALPGLEQALPPVGILNYFATAIPPMPRLPGSGAEVTGIGQVRGHVSYFFGVFKVPLHRGREETVLLIHVVLGQWIAGVAGLLLAIVWTAGFLPAFLEPSSLTVLLAKPVPRSLLLLGKVLGVVLFLGLFYGLFIVGTWWALALKTGVWVAGYLLCWPLLVFHFLLIYSFTTLLAVMTRNTAVCVFGTIVFWLICYGVNYGRHLNHGFEELAQPVVTLEEGQTTPIAQRAPASRFVVEAGYWVLPKPIDLVILLEDALQAGKNFGTVSGQKELVIMREKQAFHPWASLVSSLLGACLFLGMAVWEFHKMDY